MKAKHSDQAILLAWLVAVWSLGASANSPQVSLDRSAPIVTIVSAAPDHRVTVGITELSGVCSDNVGCAEVEWSGLGRTAGACTGGSRWKCTDVVLQPGVNVLTITGRDAAGNAGSDTWSVMFDEPLKITTTAMAGARVNRVYRRQQLSAVGGSGRRYKWDTPAGSNLDGVGCAGLSVSPEGLVSGIPTSSGTCAFTVRVADDSGGSVSKRFTIDILAANPEGPHDYFDVLKGAPEVYPIAACRATAPDDNGACSLRNQDQLNRLTNAPGPNLIQNGFIYGYISDPSTYIHDAARLEVTPCPSGCDADSGSIANNQTLAIPLDFLNTGTVLFAWDVWFGAEWRPATCGGAIGPQNNMKTFQIRAGAVDRGKIYFETRLRFLSAKACEDLAAHDNRVYPAQGLQNAPNGMIDSSPYTPTGKGAQLPNQYPVKHSTWTRYVAYIELMKAGSDPTFDDWRTAYLNGTTTVGVQERDAFDGEVVHPDAWHALTMWVCDEGRDCTRLLWRVPWKTQSENGAARHLSEFTYQFNTSAPANVRTATMTAYVRNWIALRNYLVDMTGASSREDIEKNPVILKRPVR